MAEEARRAVSPRFSPRASGGQDSEAPGPLAAGRELRLKMGPVGYSRGPHGHLQLAIPTRLRYRWETLNGWTGGCAPDCYHATPEAALACFRKPRPPGGDASQAWHRLAP